MAPISARVELIFSALKMNGSAAGSRSLQQRLPVAGGVGAHQVALHRAGGLEAGQRVHQHREEGHDHDHRGLGLPVEAEPHDHDRRDADDRHGATRWPSGSRPRCRKGDRSIATAVRKPAPEPIRKPGMAERMKVWTEIDPAGCRGAGREARARCASGGGSRTCGTSKPTTSDLPQPEQQRRRTAPARAMPAARPGTVATGRASASPGREPPPATIGRAIQAAPEPRARRRPRSHAQARGREDPAASRASQPSAAERRARSSPPSAAGDHGALGQRRRRRRRAAPATAAITSADQICTVWP